jgi:hypothetical protein
MQSVWGRYPEGEIEFTRGRRMRGIAGLPAKVYMVNFRKGTVKNKDAFYKKYFV